MFILIIPTGAALSDSECNSAALLRQTCINKVLQFSLQRTLSFMCYEWKGFICATNAADPAGLLVLDLENLWYKKRYSLPRFPLHAPSQSSCLTLTATVLAASFLKTAPARVSPVQGVWKVFRYGVLRRSPGDWVSCWNVVTSDQQSVCCCRHYVSCLSETKSDTFLSCSSEF